MNVALSSIGCRTNQEEMESLRCALAGAGHAVVDCCKDADAVVVNTCSVTARTEAKVRRLLASISRQAPAAKILVTGCTAQQHGETLLSAAANVFWVVGNALKPDITAILSGPGGVFLDEIKRTALPVSGNVAAPGVSGRTRFLLKIQEGCDNACAYCIVPRLRGPARSAPQDEIAAACLRALDAGYKEIVLTGTHIGRYQGGLLPLVERLVRLAGDYRLRLSSLDPAELSKPLLALAGEARRLCDHLHVSLQSLSPEVLSMMNRSYKELDRTIELLAAFRVRFPDAGLGADFIVGFPGESDAMFEETLKTAESIGFSYAHIFRFSARPGTAAAAMTPLISEAVKRERSEKLRAVIEKSRKKFIAAQKGKVHRIIVEQERPVRGVTSNYLAVELPGCTASRNSWLDAVIEGSAGKGKCCRARAVVS
ncbi:MAG: MiaB/RimO family radical SAM methylthiotransferase [Chitinispirillaceae bacterium]|nr:MiaB/RimO family radical SAM methylthiotransferase [Chitinispirillaceae bacterium]